MPQTVRMGLVKRRPDLSAEQFRAHWQGPHGTLAAAMPGLRSYHQNHVLHAALVPELVDPWRLDGLSQLGFDGIAEMQAAVRSPAYAPLANDTPQVMTMPGIIAGTPQWFAGQAETPARKIVLVATLSEGTATSWNSLEWSANLAGLQGVLDIRITHRESEPGVAASRDQLPVDIVTQLWFDTARRTEDALTNLGENTAYLRHFVTSAGLYLTRTHVVVAGSKKDTQP